MLITTQTCHVALVLVPLLAGPALAAAQSTSDDPGREPPRLSLGVEVGFTMPAVAYDNWVSGSRPVLAADTSSTWFDLVYQGAEIETFTTLYVERPRAAPLVRATVRYRPFALLGLYFAYQRSQGHSVSTYVGGGTPPQAFTRTLRIQSGEFGLHTSLARWAQGAGFLDYTLGLALVHHKLDLSAGHRDRFTIWRGVEPPADLEWTERDWSSFSFTGGVGARVPIGENLGVRLGMNGFVVRFGSSQVELQEAREIGRAVHPAPTFRFPSFTAFYGGARLGFDYVLSR